ncbi:MAG: hypothetical protein PHN69_07790 [Candidatus Pacebacteria bacterium]|nr:hypothetical protein [Candidatus Paceibacterota bacterium]
MDRFEKYMWILALAAAITLRFDIVICILIAKGICYVEDVYKDGSN